MSIVEPSREGLSRIDTFIIPMHVIAETISFLRHVGRSEAEGFALWGHPAATCP